MALAPVQVSATSHTPAEARQVAPALPGVWTQMREPSGLTHWSTVQGLPSLQSASFMHWVSTATGGAASATRNNPRQRTVKSRVTTHGLASTAVKNVDVGRMIWTNFTATKCRGRVELD